MEKIVGTRQYGKNCWNQARWKKKGDPGNMKKDRESHGKFWFSPFFHIKYERTISSPCFIHHSGQKRLGEPGVGCGSFILFDRKDCGNRKRLSKQKQKLWGEPGSSIVFDKLGFRQKVT